MNRLKVKGQRKLYDANMSGKKNKKLYSLKLFLIKQYSEQENQE